MMESVQKSEINVDLIQEWSHPSYKAWMKLHDETATAIAGAFPSIDLETEASRFGVWVWCKG